MPWREETPETIILTWLWPIPPVIEGWPPKDPWSVFSYCEAAMPAHARKHRSCQLGLPGHRLPSHITPSHAVEASRLAVAFLLTLPAGSSLSSHS